jgi:pimeloyl-ACP methyl ester carboxylesterase
MDGAAAIDRWLEEGWSVPAQTWQVEVDGAAIACRSWNRGASVKPGVVLAHGFRAHSRWWDHIAPWLAQGRHVVAFDFSGMGDSGWRSAYRRAHFAQELRGVAAAAGMDRPIVIAHSFGGLATLLACAQDPLFAQRIILVDSALPIPDEAGRGKVSESSARRYPDLESALARYKLRPPGRWPHPAVRAYIARHSLTQEHGEWRWKFDPDAAGSLNAETEIKDVDPVEVPADFIYGEMSELMSPERIGMIARTMPHCGEPVVIPACHHHILVEQPLALVTALRGLLANDKG